MSFKKKKQLTIRVRGSIVVTRRRFAAEAAEASIARALNQRIVLLRGARSAASTAAGAAGGQGRLARTHPSRSYHYNVLYFENATRQSSSYLH